MAKKKRRLKLKYKTFIVSANYADTLKQKLRIKAVTDKEATKKFLELLPCFYLYNESDDFKMTSSEL